MIKMQVEELEVEDLQLFVEVEIHLQSKKLK
jgi:hypothetical protein